jgi:hypothetical protein
MYECFQNNLFYSKNNIQYCILNKLHDIIKIRGVINMKYVPKKEAGRKTYDVKQTTEFLKQYGLSNSEKKTRDLILKGKLRGKSAGENPDDRRAGKKVSERAIYDYIVSEIPILEDIFEEIRKVESTKKDTK